MPNDKTNLITCIAFVLVVLFLIFSTPAPTLEAASGEQGPTVLRGMEFHTDTPSRAAPLTVAKSILPIAVPGIFFVFAAVPVIPVVWRLAFRRSVLAVVAILRHKRLLLPIKFTSTYVQ